MPYRQEYHADLDIFETVYSGSISAADLKSAVDEGNNHHLDGGVQKFLADARDIELAADVADLYELPRSYADSGVMRSARMAVVSPRSPEMKALAFFYETVCLNRNWRVRLFETREEAVEWLTAPDNP